MPDDNSYTEAVKLLSRTIRAIEEHPSRTDRALTLETVGQGWQVTLDTGPHDEDSFTWGGERLQTLLHLALDVAAESGAHHDDSVSDLVGENEDSIASSLRSLKDRTTETGESFSLFFTVTGPITAGPSWEVNWFDSRGEPVVVLDGESAQATLDVTIGFLRGAGPA